MAAKKRAQVKVFIGETLVWASPEGFEPRPPRPAGTKGPNDKGTKNTMHATTGGYVSIVDPETNEVRKLSLNLIG